VAAMNQEVQNDYEFGAFKGYAAMLSDSALDTVRNAPEVDYVEAAQMMHASACSQQTNAIWGLTRVAQRKMELHGKFPYDATAGGGVDAYIIDTGILDTHVDFENRAKMLANFVNDGIFTDCNGHGTHVAGTVGGKTYGVAKKVNLFGVKVLGCTGSGSNAGVIDGIKYATTQGKNSGRPSVINMSLGGSLSTATNQAVDEASKNGITVVVAAGNSNADACNYSPASAKEVLCVGATTVASKGGTQEDARATFSNYGSCVKIFAPGQNIQSAWIDDNTDTNSISGTSMASPHVCGLAALYISATGKSDPTTVKNALTDGATPSEIDLLCSNSACNKSPNKMAFVGCV